MSIKLLNDPWILCFSLNNIITLDVRDLLLQRRQCYTLVVRTSLRHGPERNLLQNSDLRGRKKKFLPESLPPLQCYLNFYHHVTGCGQPPSGHIALCQKQSQPKEPTSFFFAWHHDLLITYQLKTWNVTKEEKGEYRKRRQEQEKGSLGDRVDVRSGPIIISYDSSIFTKRLTLYKVTFSIFFFFWYRK